MNRHKKAIIEITQYDVPPADHSCCYRIQRAVYEIKDIAEAAISNKRSGGSNPPTTAWRSLRKWLKSHFAMLVRWLQLPVSFE